MKKVLMVVFLLLFSMNSMVWANLSDLNNSADPSSIAVVVFMEKSFINDGKAVTEMRGVLKEKFKYANNIAIYGDDQAKSPEFLEFIDKVKTDPDNEKGIKSININELATYGQSIKSNYVVLITVTPFNVYETFPPARLQIDTKASVAVIDARTKKYVEFVNYYKEKSRAFTSKGAQFLMKKIADEFNWAPPVAKLNDSKAIDEPEDKKPGVIVFLPDVILEKPNLVEAVRQSVAAKFSVKDVPIYIDDRPKSPEFLRLIAGVGTDSAKQQTFILKKERLIEYGKMINANPITAIIISSANTRYNDFNYRLKADILVIDTENNNYLSNIVFDTVDKKKRQEGIDFLLKQLQTEFQLP